MTTEPVSAIGLASINLSSDDLSGDRVKLEIVSVDSTRRALPGTFLHLDGHWLLIDVLEQLAPLTVISVERDDTLFIGEIVTCEEGLQSRWRLRIEVAHKVTSLQRLMRLNAALLGVH